MRSLTKTGFYISKRIGKAIADYSLVEDGDRILVAVSGGKDSFAMLNLLEERRRWAPVKYELIAFHVDAGSGCGVAAQAKILEKYLKRTGVRYRVKRIRPPAGRPGSSPCFWCSWNRRKTLFEAAARLGCNKVALGHHKDDIVETLLLNIFYQGEFAGMNPRQELFAGKITIIRPLCYVEEKQLVRFSKESDFPVRHHGCKTSDLTMRKAMKDFVAKLEKTCPHVKTNIFRSMSRVNAEYLKLHPEH